jgi:porphobilinogen deaminase
LNTRLRKLDEGIDGVCYDALILAAAGVRRLGWADRIEAGTRVRTLMDDAVA